MTANAEYAKGYRAGLKRKAKLVKEEHEQRRRDALWQRYMAHALASTIVAQNWTMGGDKVEGLDKRVELAARAADYALNVTIARGRL